MKKEYKIIASLLTISIHGTVRLYKDLKLKMALTLPLRQSVYFKKEEVMITSVIYR